MVPDAGLGTEVLLTTVQGHMSLAGIGTAEEIFGRVRVQQELQMLEYITKYATKAPKGSHRLREMLRTLSTKCASTHRKGRVVTS